MIVLFSFLSICVLWGRGFSRRLGYFTFPTPIKLSFFWFECNPISSYFNPYGFSKFICSFLSFSFFVSFPSSFKRILFLRWLFSLTTCLTITLTTFLLFGQGIITSWGHTPMKHYVSTMMIPPIVICIQILLSRKFLFYLYLKT